MRLATTCLSSLFVAGATFGLAQNYTFALIPNLPTGALNTATSVNSSGAVVGASGQQGNSHAYLYAQGVLTDLGTFGLQMTAMDINESNEIVGIGVDTSHIQHAFRWVNGNLTDLGTLGGVHSGARSINSSGTITGYADTDGNENVLAFRYSGGSMQGLQTLGGGVSDGYGINDAGHVVGVSTNAANNYLAFFDDGSGMVSLGTLGGSDSYANAINNSDVVVGEAVRAGNQSGHAFRYESGSMVDLGVLSGDTHSEALAINDAGDIVGWSATSQISSRAFLHTAAGMADLNLLTVDLPSQYYLDRATSISDNGFITVSVRDRQTTDMVGAALLTPVPEPLSVVAVGLGVLCLLRRKAKQSG